MKLQKIVSSQIFVLLFLYSAAFANTSGFFLPDSIQEMTLKFKTIDNLIILPVAINDSIKVNLILDTGCRNMVLFGKRFSRHLKVNKQKEILFSGLGAGEAVKGYLSLGNNVSIQSVTGRMLPIVVVPDKNLFTQYHDVHGIIGYEIFLKFQLEINSKSQTIIFRPALHAVAPPDHALVPLDIVDSRPVMRSAIFFTGDRPSRCMLMIDTGSSLGVLLKTTDIGQFENFENQTLIGRGLNGLLYGYSAKADKLTINGYDMKLTSAAIVESPWHNYASIGMNIMKDYIVVLNYCKSYACFKKIL